MCHGCSLPDGPAWIGCDLARLMPLGYEQTIIFIFVYVKDPLRTKYFVVCGTGPLTDSDDGGMVMRIVPHSFGS